MVFEVPKISQQLLKEPENQLNYQNILLDVSDGIKFIDDLNFLFTNEKNRGASKNFRILVDDLIGTVPEEAMKHVMSVCACMCAGIIEFPIGHDHIIEFMKKYGYADFTYAANGNIRIDIKKRGRNYNILSYKGGNLNQKS